MPIVVKLDEWLHALGMTLTEPSERVGLTVANVSILKTGKAKAGGGGRSKANSGCG